MKDIKKLAEIYIQRQERFYNRPLRSFNRFLIKDFADYIGRDLGLSVDQKIDEQTKNSVEKYQINKLKTNKVKIAFICEEIGHLTGGRYYAWFIAIALVELGYDVTFYTNREPIYLEAFSGYQLPKVELVKDKADLENLDVQADIYVSAPLLGNLAVCNLSEKYNKPGFCMVFDPSPMMKKYMKVTYFGWEKLAKKLKESNVNIISLTQATSDWMYDWLNKTDQQIIPIHPCINSKVLEKVKDNQTRENYVVFISRLVKHKKFEDVLYAAKEADIDVHVISSNDGIGLEAVAKKYGMKNRVFGHLRVSDQEKFEIISKAKAVVSGSIFEGFGMWAAEAVSTGTPLICYDFPTIHEIQKTSGVDNFYMAEWDNKKDLAEKLKQALTEGKFRERNKTFYYESLVAKVKKTITAEPKIGVITIALNEDKFIGASLRSVIKHPNVKKVAVVEGAVNLFSHASNDKGLSQDRTKDEILKVIYDKNGEKIIYEQYGWALDKSELRNRALMLLGKGIDYVLVVDADEVWKKEDLDNLIQAMKDNPRAGVFLFSFYHFWKQKNLVATGGQWESQMFRCFKYEDKTLHWEAHNAPVVNIEGKFINQTDGSIAVEGVHVYHYGYMKDPKRVQEKLEYYKKRDGSFLDVKDTFTDWKKGQPTQPTHGGGDVAEFKGSHPEEVLKII